MSKAELELCRKALYEVERMEILKYDSLPQEWGDHSDDFNEKIKSLIAKTRRKESSYILMNSKKIIIAALTAILIASILVACRYAPLIKQFVIKIFEGHTDFEVEDDRRISIEEIYNPEYIPDDFIMVDKLESSIGVKWIWENHNDSIIIDQSVISNNSIGIDTSQREYSKTSVGEIDVYYTASRGSYCAVWIYDNYTFSLVCPEWITWESVERIILGMKPDEI